MLKAYFAAMLVATAAPASASASASAYAQPATTVPVIQPSPDSAETRQQLRDLSACLAQWRPRWARQTLSHPYLSEAQARSAAEALTGEDRCLRAAEVEVTFRTSSMVGALAEHYLRTDIGRADLRRLGAALSTLAPLNASEDFAMCIAARNPTAARKLSLSQFGSAAETEAAAQLATHLEACTNPGERLSVDLQSLRALTSTALYRAMSTTLAARN